MRTLSKFLLILGAVAAFPPALAAANPSFTPTAGDKLFQEYFRQETAKLAQNTLAHIKSLDDWKAKRDGCRQQLFEMLGLSPMPEKTDLKPVVTGKIEQDTFTVEKLHFQSRPGLYVTANLYVPKGLKKPAPAILYVCGHSLVKTNGISYGNKTSYQHHGIWFARNGYVCLIIDTVQLGELEGIHHGTYREKMWWWNSRGYSSAAVEAWNCIRSLDYLQSRPEVDPQALGITGRSGGGGYSWWTAALDERIKAACPVAGMTDLQNQVVDGCIEGHCDCMFMVNTHRWDYAQVAALIAPRPLLICNSDKDGLFPLEGVMRLHAKTREIYKLYGATNSLGVLITEGPHKDTQDLQVPVFRWFNRHLKGEDPVIDMAAVKLFTPQQLKVFETMPADQCTTTIHETFVQLADPAATVSGDARRENLLVALRAKTFAAWPAGPVPPNIKQAFSAERNGVRLSAYDFASQTALPLRFYAIQRTGMARPRKIHVYTADVEEWHNWLAAMKPVFGRELQEELKSFTGKSGMGDFETLLNSTVKSAAGADDLFITTAPRGVGLTAMANEARHETHMRRRFMQLGQTLAGMQAWDVRQAIAAVRTMDGADGVPLRLEGAASMDAVNVFAAMYEGSVAELKLIRPPGSDKEWADFLNFSRIVTPSQAVELVRQRTQVSIGSTP